MHQRNIRIMMIDNDPAAHCYHKAIIENADLDKIEVKDYLEVEPALKDIQQAIHKEHVENLPDVILLDINMPNVDGWSFIEQLKEMKTLQKTPKIFIVSNSLNPIDKLKVENNTFLQGFKQKFLDLEFFKQLTS